jgi:hypothetical protein
MPTDTDTGTAFLYKRLRERVLTDLRMRRPCRRPGSKFDYKAPLVSTLNARFIVPVAPAFSKAAGTDLSVTAVDTAFRQLAHFRYFDRRGRSHVPSDV